MVTNDVFGDRVTEEIFMVAVFGIVFGSGIGLKNVPETAMFMIGTNVVPLMNGLHFVGPWIEVELGTLLHEGKSKGVVFENDTLKLHTLSTDICMPVSSHVAANVCCLPSAMFLA